MLTQAEPLGGLPSLHGMTTKEFASLPDEDKRTILVQELTRWTTGVANLEARSTTLVWPAQYSRGNAGQRLKEPNRYACQHRSKDGSYYCVLDWFSREDKGSLTTHGVTAMNVKTGEARSIGKYGKLEQVCGLIESEASRSVQVNRLAYWLAGVGNCWAGEGADFAANFPLQYLLKHQKAIKFDGLGEGSQTFQISLDVDSPESRFADHRTVWISVEKGFMPVRMHRHWELSAVEAGKPPALTTVTDTEVKEMRQIGDSWFPWHIVETIRGTRGGEELVKGVADVNETIVDEIKLGSVTDEDLEVQFPPGCYVEDRVRSLKYRVGNQGEHLPFASEIDVRSVDHVSSGVRWRFIWVGTIFLLGCCLALYVWRRR